MNKGEIKAVVKAAGGSTLTRDARFSNLTAIANELKQPELNIQIKSFTGLKTQHLSKLVSLWVGQGKSARTIHNKLAHIRAALVAVGREKFANSKQVSNAALGAPKASRAGTHNVSSPDVVNTRISALPPGIQEAARLQQTLGLRAQEAIQSVQSLKRWEMQILNGQRVTILHGTKGGRARDTSLPSENARSAALEAVRAAIKAAATQEGRLVPSSSLEGAKRAYQRAMNEVGFKGTEASHSLRYHFARAQFERYQEMGFERKEALSALSMDLGHGDGRGRYCAHVYLKGQTD